MKDLEIFVMILTNFSLKLKLCEMKYGNGRFYARDVKVV